MGHIEKNTKNLLKHFQKLWFLCTLLTIRKKFKKNLFLKKRLNLKRNQNNFIFFFILDYLFEGPAKPASAHHLNPLKNDRSETNVY